MSSRGPLNLFHAANEREKEEANKKEHDNVLTQKDLTQVINTNFGEKDIWVVLTYKAERSPAGVDAANEEVMKYLRRLKKYCVQHNLQEMKYVYTTDHGEGSGIHHHLVCNFQDRDKAEELWEDRGRTQVRFLQQDIENLARYISKDKNDMQFTISRTCKVKQDE